MSTTQTKTISELFASSVQKYRDLPALGFVDQAPLKYGSLDELTRRLALGLRTLGVQPGDKVGLLSENMPNWGAAYLAIVRMGAVVVPILPDFSSPEVANILSHADARTAFVSEKQAPKVKSIEDVQFISLDSFELDGISILGETNESADVAVSDDELAAIIYTSGTTGSSKGVMLTHGNIVSNVKASLPLAEILPGETMLSLLPLSHSYECTLGFLVPLAAGACVYYLSKPPSPSVLMPALASVRPHVMLSVPLFIEKIFRNSVLPKLKAKAILRILYGIRPIQRLLHKAAGRKVYAMFGGRLHFFGVGGAALAPDVERFLRDAGFPYAIGYGLTETSPLVAGTGPKYTTFHAIGPVVEGVTVRLDNQYGGKGEGEVQVKGPNVMRGYYKDEKRTSEVFTEDGWFRTGDIGHFTNKGVLSIRGRIKNMILGASGENIYPEEIEAIINEKPYVEESLVLQKGGQLVAMVYLNYEALLDHVASMYSNVKDWHAEVQQTVKDNITDSADYVNKGIERFRADVDSYASELRQRINEELNAFSRLADVVLRYEPFQKTPTMKIKRYLYSV